MSIQCMQGTSDSKVFKVTLGHSVHFRFSAAMYLEHF